MLRYRVEFFTIDRAKFDYSVVTWSGPYEAVALATRSDYYFHPDDEIYEVDVEILGPAAPRRGYPQIQNDIVDRQE